MNSGAREGWVALSSVLVVNSVEEEAAFLKTVFQAEIGMLIRNGQGEAQRAEARIGDSIFLLLRASATLAATHSVTRIPMSKVQATIELAMQNGGASVPVPDSAVEQQGDGAVTDPQGNIWWIAPQDRKPSNEEIQRRLTEQRRDRL
jgi:uncharacterized glyoxalase superfamily protein PhnB